MLNCGLFPCCTAFFAVSIYSVSGCDLTMLACTTPRDTARKPQCHVMLCRSHVVYYNPGWVLHLCLEGAVAPRQQHDLPRQRIGETQGRTTICRHPRHQRVGCARADSTRQAIAKVGKHDCVGGVGCGGSCQRPSHCDLICFAVCVHPLLLDGPVV